MPRFDLRSFILRSGGFFAFWVVLAGTKPADLAAGLAAAFVAAAVSLPIFPPTQRRRRLLVIMRLAFRFLRQSVIAGFDVAWRALHPALPLRPGFVTYETQLPQGRLRAGFCTLTSLLPGTLPLGTDNTGRLVVHVLDTRQPVVEQLKHEEMLFAQATELSAMNEFFFASAAVVLLMVTVGTLRVLRGPHNADRLMSAQLIGSGGVAALLLLSVGMNTSAIVDVALVLGLLAAFASIAFVNKAAGIERDAANEAKRS